MYTDEQEKLIESFTIHTNGICRTWKEVCELRAPVGIHLEDVYRKLYAAMAPDEPSLSETWSHKMTVVSLRGDGMLETSETLYMPSAEKEYTYELFVRDLAFVKTNVSDREPDDSPWIFSIHAPTVAALNRIVVEFTKLIPPMPESKTPVNEERRVVASFKKNAQLSDSVCPKLIISVMPRNETGIFVLKEYLEKIPGITNLEYDFLYNLAECKYDYEKVDFNFKNYHFSVSDNNEDDEYKWNFYVEGGECPEDIISELVEYFKLFRQT